MMDEDEVTREPFEDQNNDDEDDDEAGSTTSWNQLRYDPVRKGQEDIKDLDTIDGISISEQEADDGASSVCDEDIDYAKSFGIQLKNPKVQTNVQRLMNSSLFESSKDQRKQQQQQQPSVQSKEPGKPVIKTSTTSDCIYHKGCFYQKGDIVALCDQDDGQVYFAQLTGFLQDQYCEKSASLNWLVPTRPTSRKCFDPSAYRLGLEDNQLRKLDCMTFVCRCPHDYYMQKFFQSSSGQAPRVCNEPLETSYKKSNKSQTYIWTTMKPCDVPTIETREQD